MAAFDFNYLNPFGLNNLVVQNLSHNMLEWIPVTDATFRGPAALRRQLGSRRRSDWLGPVGIAKLPAAVAILRDACKVSAVLDAVTVGPHLNLVIRSSHDSEIRRERIDAQIIAPFQLNLFDGKRDLRKSRRSLRTICKSDFAIDGHEECRRVGKILAPSCRAVLRNVMRHVAHKCSHTVIDRRRALGR
jgi:hypothetical protein